MLRYARMKMPAVRFHHQDMTNFSLDTKFDAVICPFDSINHLLKFEDWIRTFKAVRRHLNPGGVFVFDINTEYRLRTLSSSPPWVHQFGTNYLVMRVSISADGIADWDVHVFEHGKGKNYRLHREVIRERSFGHTKVTRALKTSFENVRAYDSAGWSRPKKTSGRLFYVCGVG
jgi:SAM-dependent methyltransferase